MPKDLNKDLEKVLGELAELDSENSKRPKESGLDTINEESEVQFCT